MTFFVDLNSSVAIPFQRLRALMAEQGGGIQEGVANAGDLKVSQRGAGANLSADVAVGAAWIQVDTGSRNGIGHVFSDAVFNAGPFTGGHATLPRVDQVIARWNDSSIPTGTGNTLTIEVLTGTATSGAQISNTAGANYRAGATALPNDCMRVADVLMPALASSVTTANIVDRRPWARGAYNRLPGSASGASYTITTTGTLTAIDATNLQARVECSGVPLLLQFSGNGSVTGGTGIFEFTEDGATAAISGGQQLYSVVGSTAFTLYLPHVPAAGSHVYGVSWRNSTNAITLLNQATGAGSSRPYFTIMEVIRPNASNT